MWPFGKRAKVSPALLEMPQRIPTVKFDPGRVTPAVEACILSTLKSIPELSGELAVRLYGAAIESVRSGRDLKVLRDSLTDIGLSQKEASEIALFVNNRASSVIQREEQISGNIKNAIWMHSGAPCVLRPKHSTRSESNRNADHISVDGKQYDVAKGMLIRGKCVWPGEELGCKCFSRPVLPAFK